MSEQGDPSAGVSDDRLGVRIGSLALERKWISQDQLRSALSAQARETTPSRRPRPLGDLLLALGFLDRPRLQALLAALELERTRVAAPRSLPPPSRPAAPLPAPLGRFGKYRLLRKVGHGPAGVIYQAVDDTLGRIAALKVLEAGEDVSEEDEERLLQEAQVLGGLPRHPGIAGVYDSGRVEGKRYIALEFVEGVPLDQWWKSPKAVLKERIRVLRDGALALQFAHQHGVIHRDLKPQSILIDASGNPHIVEFGLAVPRRLDAKLSLTQTGFVVGTPGYLSPEQAEGRKNIDPRTDVYSLGAILFQTLTGRLPFIGDTSMEILLKGVREAVPRPSTVSKRGPVDRRLEQICLKALARRPAERHASAQAFAGELTQWLRGSERPLRWIGMPAATAGGAALLVLVVALAAASGKRTAPHVETSAHAAAPPPPTAPRPPVAPEPPAKPPDPPPLSRVSWEPGRENGLRRVPLKDGPGEVLTRDGVRCVGFLPNDDGNRRLYFDVDEIWAERTCMVELEMEALATENGSWLSCEFDSADDGTPFKGAYRASLPIPAGIVGQWVALREILPAVAFRNRQWDQADFRLTGKLLVFRRLSLRRLDPADFAVQVSPRPLSPAPAWNAPGLLGEYFSDLDFGRRVERRADLDLRFRWPGPAVPGGPDDGFTIRWTGGLKIEREAEFLFDSVSDNGLRLDLGGARLIAEWISHLPLRSLASVKLAPGLYPIKVDYFDDQREGLLSLQVLEKRGDKLIPISPGCFVHDPRVSR